MKKIIINYITLLGVVFLCCSSCTRDDSSIDNQGWITLSGLDIETTVNTISGGVTKSETTPVFSVVIKNSSGSEVAHYDDHTQMPSKIELTSGGYTVTASTGSRGNASAGFDSPIYKGSSDITVVPGSVTPVTLTCTLSDIKVDISYSDKFKQNFTEYKTEVSNGVQSLVFEKGETQSGYFEDTGSITYTLTVENNQGSKYSDTKTYTTLKSKDNLNLHFDVNDKVQDNDNFLFFIDVNETLNEVTRNFTIRLKKGLMPTLTGDNFDISKPVQVAYGTVKTTVVNASSTIGFNNIYLRHKSQELVSIGLPMMVDLMHLTADESAAINRAGISYSVTGESNNDLKVDFSNFTPKLSKAENAAKEHVVELLVTDMQQQFVNSDLTFYVIGTSLVLDNVAVSDQFTWNSVTGLGETSAVLTGVWTTIERPVNLTFAIRRSIDAKWENVSTSQITYNDVTKTVTANLSKLKLKTNYKYKLVSDTEESGEGEFTTKYPSLYNMNLNDWYKDGRAWYPKLNSSTPTIWSTGNSGLTMFPVNKESNTTPEDNLVSLGNRGVKMVSWNGILAVGFAAGNLFVGEFKTDMSNPAASVKFGKPYTGRPNKLKFFYRYLSTQINTDGPHLGETDQCYIYIRLENWGGATERPSNPEIIGYGELKDNRKMDVMVQHTINVDYSSTKQPTHIVIVATSSIYGDQFIGGANSTLYIDDFEFEFD